MPRLRATFICAVAAIICSSRLAAHPPSALVSDRQANVYFSYWDGTWKLDPQGRLGRLHANDFHFLTIDVPGRFARAMLHDLLRLTPDGQSPALFSLPEFPATFHTDGPVPRPVCGGKNSGGADH